MLADGAKNLIANRRFDREHPNTPQPPFDLLFETQTTTSHARYLTGGRERASFILSMIEEHLPPGPVRVCEWGCGPGRVIRHLPSIDKSRAITAFGTDYNPMSIKWCNEHIPDVTFRLNALEPPLPFDDGAFDCLYSFSVYTHLPPALQRRWLDENLRVVRPGGIVIMTLHGDSYRRRLVDTELETYDATGIVVRAGVSAGGPWYTTYQRPDQVERELLNGLDVIRRETYPDTGIVLQDVWAVRKPLAAT
ncbi:MAG: hypothetical protein QOC92_89 [Acidimicrobiaceae bacterium]